MKTERKSRQSPHLTPPNSPELTNEFSIGVTSQWVSLLLALMMIMAPAMGVPSEEVLQDTLKSAIIALISLGAALVFFWRHLVKPTAVVWHQLLWLPIGLAVYALTSMIWSHTYLAGVEAVRWFVFSIILLLCMNLRFEDSEDRLAWGIHLGVTVASFWTALQFLYDFNVFPQGPNPASTFVNRNFFGEYAICALPYSLYLLLRAKSDTTAFTLAASIGLNLAALMMTGTRSALIAFIMLLLLFVAIYFKNRKLLELTAWNWHRTFYAGAIVLSTTLILGLIPNGNPKLTAEFGSLNAIERAMGRTLSIAKADEYTTGSFSIRSVMWKATARMAAKNPILGVGAGAWEVEAPLYQQAGSQLETDYYAHNEFLQLLAEYGVVGWLFIGCLLTYVAHASHKTWFRRIGTPQHRFLIRTAALASVLMLMIVSNAGFPWRLASTAALLATSLGLLAGSDASVSQGKDWMSSQFDVSAAALKSLLVLGFCSLLLATYLTQRAVNSERNLIRGVKLALTISKSGRPNDPYWDQAKQQMFQLLRSGIEENRHYRKLTPMAADEIASWGDWKNAAWIWKSVLESRPNVVAIIANLSRASLEAGDIKEAQEYLERAKRLQPTAPAVRTLNIMFLERSGQQRLAASEIRKLLQEGVIDYDLIYSAYLIGARTNDWPLMIQALELRIDHWPIEAVDGWLKLGKIYDEKPEVRDTTKALHAYRAALDITPVQDKDVTLSKIPESYRSKSVVATK